jgi:hypothetical protein
MGLKTYATIEVDGKDGITSTQVDVLFCDQESPKIRAISINGCKISTSEWIAIKDFVQSKLNAHFDVEANITDQTMKNCRNCNGRINYEGGETNINGYCAACYGEPGRSRYGSKAARDHSGKTLEPIPFTCRECGKSLGGGDNLCMACWSLQKGHEATP